MLRVSQERLRRKDGDKSRMWQSTSRATRSVEQNKARKIEADTSLQRAERLEVLSKTRQCLSLNFITLTKRYPISGFTRWVFVFTCFNIHRTFSECVLLFKTELAENMPPFGIAYNQALPTVYSLPLYSDYTLDLEPHLIKAYTGIGKASKADGPMSQTFKH